MPVCDEEQSSRVPRRDSPGSIPPVPSALTPVPGASGSRLHRSAFFLVDTSVRLYQGEEIHPFPFRWKREVRSVPNQHSPLLHAILLWYVACPEYTGSGYPYATRKAHLKFQYALRPLSPFPDTMYACLRVMARENMG